ncbi:NBR1-Ig-like domain-containing protein [Pedosphaera parvula]|uniref:Nbr1 FW domain-containing protein n=1 Tax=Pedosphaera parvula (strain Ellin514) TaxID=320771 RepID=B9XF79_PEDPL|nr:NBR1-Ig-like domain-containing protein [Pedosphaera parvula]EEF61577.1 hypothetical protein Cflav_PD4255 [Pedosphaera parvula Ellin514]
MKKHNIFASASPIGIVSISLGILIGNISVLAADNAALISVSVTNNQPVMPRTIFTQTWTVQNTGTTTWTAGASGYTLNMVGRDSLGAIELYTNTASKHYKPTAIINGGHSVAPGQQATFSMSFIAPEPAGLYTDTFQMNSASSVFFGPMLTVQVTVQSAGSTNQYDRARAVSFANNYAGYVVPDGYFWTNSSGFYFYGSNAPVPTTLIGDDCAHFVSCCIGRQTNEWGGGLPIPSRASPTYGEPGAGRLVSTVLIGGGYAKEVFSLNDMMPGDVVGWNWEGDTNIANLDHVTFYVGNGMLASHAASALDVSANTWYQSSESLAV